MPNMPFCRLYVLFGKRIFVNTVEETGICVHMAAHAWTDSVHFPAGTVMLMPFGVRHWLGSCTISPVSVLTSVRCIFAHCLSGKSARKQISALNGVQFSKLTCDMMSVLLLVRILHCQVI